MYISRKSLFRLMAMAIYVCISLHCKNSALTDYISSDRKTKLDDDDDEHEK